MRLPKPFLVPLALVALLSYASEPRPAVAAAEDTGDSGMPALPNEIPTKAPPPPEPAPPAQPAQPEAPLQPAPQAPESAPPQAPPPSEGAPIEQPTAEPSPTARPRKHKAPKARPPKKPVKKKGPRNTRIPKLLQEVEARYAEATTLTASFDEADLSAALGQTKKSSGKLEFKRPGMVHWETLKPDKSLLVSDGEKFWFYTPPFDASEHGQYMEKRASRVQSRLAQTLLSADFSSKDVANNMKIRQASRKEFILTPKAGTAGSVTKARIVVDADTKTIVAVHLEHQGGNKTDIELSDITLGDPLPDEHFQFTPPPGTDHVPE